MGVTLIRNCSVRYSSQIMHTLRVHPEHTGVVSPYRWEDPAPRVQRRPPLARASRVAHLFWVAKMRKLYEVILLAEGIYHQPGPVSYRATGTILFREPGGG